MLMLKKAGVDQFSFNALIQELNIESLSYNFTKKTLYKGEAPYEFQNANSKSIS